MQTWNEEGVVQRIVRYKRGELIEVLKDEYFNPFNKVNLILLVSERDQSIEGVRKRSEDRVKVVDPVWNSDGCW